MGNKPDLPPITGVEPDSLTASLVRHPHTAYYHSPLDPPPGVSCKVLFPFMLDELLIGQEVLDTPAALTALSASASSTHRTVFDNLQSPNEDVAIWRLNDLPNDKPWPDVAEFVWTFRNDVLGPLNINPAKVAPNHILVPAPDFHECPFGPPWPHAALATPVMRSPSVTVGVVDSGWEASGPAKGLVASAGYGDWLDEGGWSPSAAAGRVIAPTAGRPARLRALAGHANFVAGLVAMKCERARIIVESHNAAFLDADAGDPAIPTEASVARSIWRLAKHLKNPADLINVGFAFPVLPKIRLTLQDLVELVLAPDASPAKFPPSWTLQVVLDSLGEDGPFIVAPAGNQGCIIPQYPAAFGGLGYKNVVGVASVDPPNPGGVREKSVFTNYGPWVSCSAGGSNVVSTFFSGYTGETEDSDDPENPGNVAALHSTKAFDTGWARWSGTSFAAPKVAGDLAERQADGRAPADAWDDLKATGAAEPGLGVVLPY
jgi:hypothetical protein